MAQTVEDCGLDLIQLHGDESPEYCRRFPPERVIKAVFPRTPEDSGRLTPTMSGPSWWTPGRRAVTAERGSGPTGSWPQGSGGLTPDPGRRPLHREHRRGAGGRRPPGRGHQQRLRAGARDQGSRPDAADHRHDPPRGLPDQGSSSPGPRKQKTSGHDSGSPKGSNVPGTAKGK